MLYLICLVVGFLVGGTGMGGILIPPALVLASGLDTHTAMGTTLASFIPMNIAGCILFRRMGHLNLAMALPLILGGSLSAGLCAVINVYCNPTFLTTVLACLVLFAGVTTFRPPKPKQSQISFWHKPVGLFGIGLSTGTAAGLTGAGGPLLAIAWMVAAAIHPLTAVGLSMPYSLATAITATCANWANGSVDWPILWRVAGLELLGFLVGVVCVSKLPILWIKRCMGLTCLFLGTFLLAKTLLNL